MLKEFCAENHEKISQAIALGAKRVELCDNLTVGGTTPSYGVIDYVCRLAKEHEVGIMTMIRPRGGNFCYDQAEVSMMLVDIDKALELGSDGCVFGALTEDNWLDESAMEALIERARGGEIVFHMAFDSIPRSRQKEAMDWLIARGVTRILTHGGLASSPIDNHVDWLKELVEHAAGRIEILIGGGVNHENAAALCEAVGTNQAHGSRICW